MYHHEFTVCIFKILTLIFYFFFYEIRLNEKPKSFHTHFLIQLNTMVQNTKPKIATRTKCIKLRAWKHPDIESISRWCYTHDSCFYTFYSMKNEESFAENVYLFSHSTTRFSKTFDSLFFSIPGYIFCNLLLSL